MTQTTTTTQQQPAAQPNIWRRWDETRAAEMALARAWQVALASDPTSPAVAALRALWAEAEAAHSAVIDAALEHLGVAQ